MNKAFILAIALFVSGCATSAKYGKLLDTWIGSSEVELIRKWGTPQSVYDTNGRRFMTFVSSRNIYIPGMAPSYTTTYVGNQAFTNQTGGYPGTNVSKTCATTFEIVDSRVVSWRFEGNDCRSS